MSEPRFAAITACVVAVIIYGSLSPFTFYHHGSILDAVRFLFLHSPKWWDRGDALSNVLLYIPLGLFGARTLRNMRAGTRVLAVTLAGGLLSTAIEITQFFDLTRASELSDIVANVSGTLTGVFAEMILRKERFRRIEWHPFAIALLVTGMGVWLYPFIPSLDAHRYLRALHAAAVSPEFAPLLIYKQALFWLVVGMLVDTLGGTVAGRIATPVIAACVLAARVAIPGAAVTRPDVIGAALGAAAWSVFFYRLRARTGILAGLFAAFVVIDALRPFQFLPAPRAFGWTPFLGFISGPRGSASRIFMEKTFIYGTLVWLLVRFTKSWMKGTAAALVLVLASRIAQVWIPGRSADITDALMVLILAALMRAIGD